MQLFFTGISFSIIQTTYDLKDQDIQFIRKFGLYLLNLVMSPLKPVYLLQKSEHIQAVRSTLIIHEKNRQKVLELYKEEAKIREAFGRYIKIDIGLEVFLQMSAQVNIKLDHYQCLTFDVFEL